MTELEDLWYGNVIPHEQFLDGNAEYRNLLSQMVKRRDELETSLTEKQKELLTAYDAACAELNALSDLSAFTFGIKLGVKLMIEALFHN